MRLTAHRDREQECVDRTIAWLHQVWLMMETDRPFQADPFYDRNELLTPQIVEQVVESVESLFESELQNYPAYHRTAQGISASEYLVPPGFRRLPMNQKLALVQGIDRIFQEYRFVEPEYPGP